MRLIPSPPSFIKSGSIIFDEEIDLLKLTSKEMESIRGSEIGMIFQDPMTSLNPTMTIGKQITEGLVKHQGLSNEKAQEQALELLLLVGIPHPENRIKQYPHEFSGGMRQRVMIAISLACRPKLLIADEPTTALDVTIQAQILNLLKDLQQKMGSSIIIITHNLGVVADIAQRVLVMYAGKIVEQGTVDDIFYSAQHPYTWGLLHSILRLDNDEKNELLPIEGMPPDLLAPPQGCAFAARCPKAMNICLQEDPQPQLIQDEHSMACWLMDKRVRAEIR